MTLDVKFDAGAAFDVAFGADCDFRAEMGQVMQVAAAPAYRGEYTVIPKNYEETQLPTEGKLMGKNVTVKKIPRYEVANDAGGLTLMMGDEYYGQ